MAFQLFGWSFGQTAATPPEPITFTPKDNDDGAIVVAAAGAYGTYLDLDGTVRTEAELINRYREMSLHPEIDSAADEIVNEAINTEDQELVKLNLDDLKQPQNVKKAIEECFEDVLNLLDFRGNAYNIFKRWYIDGRLYFHAIIDEKDATAGIKELRYIDPRKIRKVREVIKKSLRGGEAINGDIVYVQTKNEYYIYNEKGFNTGSGRPVGPATTGMKIAADTIVQSVSGLTDVNGLMVLGYLHKAIKALNQLRTLEDANVIYCLSRAPERRVWYIDVGNLPKMKAEQYVRDIMTKHKNRLIYDASSGTIRDDRKFMTMLEDYWLPRREGNKGTEVETLPAGQNCGEMSNVEYFLKRLYAALHVPVSRLNSEDMFTMGQDLSAGISREEIKFGKFIGRLRHQFCKLFLTILCKQMVLKQIITQEDFKKLAPFIRFDFTKDNYFMEIKENQVLLSRINVIHNMMDLIGRYYSNEWVQKNVLHFSDEDIERMQKQIVEEMANPIYNPPNEMDAESAKNDNEEGGGPGGESGKPQEVPPEAQSQLAKAQSVYQLLQKNKPDKTPDFRKAGRALAKNG